MKSRRKLTPAQEAARDARRAKFKTLWKQVSAMPECERILIANKLGLVTCDGHALSPGNQYLIFLQNNAASVLGGFRQWQKHGRRVKKGEHGAMIWVPCGSGKKATGEATPASQTDGAAEPGAGGDSFFVVGTMFDISQTEEMKPGSFSPEMPEAQPEPAAEPQQPAPAFVPQILPKPTPAAPAVTAAPQMSLL